MNTTIYSQSSLPQDDFISFEIRSIVFFVFFIVLCATMSVLGMVTNAVNIVVFVKIGFKDNINISLLGLAVADFMCVFIMFWISLSASPVLEEMRRDFHEFDVTYMTGAWPRVYFIRITSFITAFITLERCLCIAIPLKVKSIITSLKTKVIIVSIYVVMLVFFIPLYSVNKLEWRHNLSRNRTQLTITYTENKVMVETATFPVYGVAMPTVTLLSVVVCTIILVAQLNSKRHWRKESAAIKISNLGTSALKDKRVVKMVTLVSTVFIICNSPAAVIFVVMTCEPEISFTGRFVNTYYVIWSLVMLLETINSSVNIFVYYNMSSKFKVILKHLIPYVS